MHNLSARAKPAFTTLIALIILASPNAEAKRGRFVAAPAPAPAPPPDPLADCEGAAHRITTASHIRAAEDTLADWLDCVARTGVRPNNLEARLQAVLDRTPYDQVARAKHDIVAHFAESTRKKPLPETPRELHDMVRLVDHQLRYARAAGSLDETELKKKEEVLKKLQKLATIVDSVVEGN